MEILGQRYRLLDPLGEGGMATVYKAQDLLLERLVAVKVLREHWAADADFVARFRQEARAAARLSHPNIVAIYDVGEDTGRHFIVMEYVDGSSLKEGLARGPLTPLRAIQVGIQVCAGLDYAHRKGLIHRDIKPHNILLCQDSAKIADFGIARALGVATTTQGGEVFGSPHYLSPEQAIGQEATAASDVYSLGVLLYEACTGKLPFQGETPLATALKHLNETPVPPRQLSSKIPTLLEAIVLKALDKDPQRRFSSAAEMGQALADCLSRAQEDTAPMRTVPPSPAPSRPVVPQAPREPAIAAPPPNMRRKPRKERRGFPWAPVMGSMALIFLVVGLTFASPSLVKRLVPQQGISSLPTQTAVPATPTVPPTPQPTSTATPKPLVLVPGVTGMLPLDARVLVEGQSLVYRESGRETSDSVAEGRITKQAPQPGTGVAPGSVVSVTTSQGPAMVKLPDMTNLTVAQAGALLKELGLRYDFKEAWSSTVVSGTVFLQDPAPGTAIAKGGLVTITASKGRERVAVPNVVGMAENAAQRAITQAGLRNFRYVNYQGHDVLPSEILRKVCVGCVLSTKPGPGELVDPGTEIQMAIRKD